MRLKEIVNKVNLDKLRNEVKDIDSKVNDLLNQFSALPSISEAEVKELDRLSSSAAKLAYGNDHPELISDQLRVVISWCDHLNEPEIKKKFIGALKKRPLIGLW